MDNENAHAQVDVVEQEEITSQDDFMDSDDSSEETITIPKSKFTKIQRRAKAYESLKEKDEPRKTNNRSDERFERMELKVEGFNDEEVEVLMKNGGKEALKNKFVMAGIESVRTQTKAEAAILGSEGQKSIGSSGISPEAFAKLSSDEQLKVLRDSK